MNKNSETSIANDNKKNKFKPKLFLAFWMGLYSLFVTSSLLSLFFGFWAVVIILLVWLFFIFILKKFSISLITSMVGLVVVFLFSIFYLVLFVGNSQNSKQGKINNKEALPILEMTITKAPKAINCDNENSVIEIKAKNIGKKSLTFVEIKNHQYDFGICDGDKSNKNGSSCFPLMDGYLKIDNFGEIKVGETKTIKFITPNKYSNAISSFHKSAINGDYRYYINFVQIKNPKLKPTLSKSNIFTVQTNIMNSANEYIKVKCRKK